MKLLIETVILLTVILLPLKGTDVGKLIPVEVLMIEENGVTVTVRTDTGDQGEGSDLEAALRNLEETAPGIIYLDTAEYVLLEQGTQINVKQVQLFLKERVRICRAEEGIPLDGIADFLSVHEPGVKLGEWKNSSEIPVLREENGRFEIK